MTDNNHPITPPQELVQLWLENYFGCWDDVNVTVADASSYIATQTSQWIYEQRGADIQKARDEELEACCEWLNDYMGTLEAGDLRAARRPKPKSLKVQALEAAQRFYANGHDGCNEDEVKDDFDIICRALESLPS